VQGTQPLETAECLLGDRGVEVRRSDHPLLVLNSILPTEPSPWREPHSAKAKTAIVGLRQITQGSYLHVHHSTEKTARLRADQSSVRVTYLSRT
jgi:hypothetical protein